MSKIRQGLTILGFVSLSLTGCAIHSAENRRLLDELGRAERSASDNQRRIAELEWRMREIERRLDPRNPWPDI